LGLVPFFARAKHQKILVLKLGMSLLPNFTEMDAVKPFQVAVKMCIFVLTEQALLDEIAHLEREIQQYRVRIIEFFHRMLSSPGFVLCSLGYFLWQGRALIIERSLHFNIFS